MRNILKIIGYALLGTLIMDLVGVMFSCLSYALAAHPTITLEALVFIVFAMATAIAVARGEL